MQAKKSICAGCDHAGKTDAYCIYCTDYKAPTNPEKSYFTPIKVHSCEDYSWNGAGNEMICSICNKRWFKDGM